MGPSEGRVGVRASSGRKGSEKKLTSIKHLLAQQLWAGEEGKPYSQPLAGDGQAVVSLP